MGYKLDFEEADRISSTHCGMSCRNIDWAPKGPSVRGGALSIPISFVTIKYIRQEKSSFTKSRIFRQKKF